MDCPQTEWLSNKEYLRQFRKKVSEQRIPLSGSFDLTHRCNLRCVHCYLGDKENNKKNHKKELSTEKWISIIDEITKAGCLKLLITGGEPFLRKDFSDIYCHAKKNGMLVTIFSNGTMITDEIIELFCDLPPQTVEISLYGATASTYEKITGVKGSYNNCLDGIEKLLDHHIKVKLKTILMTLNRHEFYDIENIAQKYGVDFRFDSAIFPCINGERTPLDLRVHPNEVVTMELSDDDRLRKWNDYYQRMKEIKPSDSLYKCGAGRNGFHINAYGQLHPCLMITHLEYNLQKGDFISGWKNDMPRLRERKMNSSSLCNHCDKLSLCGFCPAFFYLETGTEDTRSQYLCDLGGYRLKTLEAKCG